MVGTRERSLVKNVFIKDFTNINKNVWLLNNLIFTFNSWNYFTLSARQEICRMQRGKPTGVCWICHLTESGREQPFMENLGVWNYPFIAIIPRSTQTRNDITCYSPIYESNRSVWKLLVMDKFGLVCFYGISTIVGNLMPNLFYTYISNMYDSF